MQIVIEHNIKNVMRDLDLLNKGLHDKAMVKALNATAKKANTDMKRAITSVFRMKQKDFKASLHLTRAKKGKLEAVLSATGRRSFNLIRFVKGLRPNTTPQYTKRGKRKATRQLGIQVLKKGGVKNIKGAFIGNKGRTVFRRTTDARQPIEALSTLGVPSMFNTKRVNKRVRKKIRQDFPIEFDRAAKLHIARFNKR